MNLCFVLAAVSFLATLIWYEPVVAGKQTVEQQDHMTASEELPIIEERDPDADLHETAQRWIRMIAEQHKLVPWQEAEYLIEPLGPGTHGWLVHVTDGQSPIGYLIITALEEGGYRLAEYGVGDRPIFHMETLRASLERHGMIDTSTTAERLAQWVTHPRQTESADADDDEQEKRLTIERHYLYPFAAYWKVKDRELKQAAYFDAITGEQYPLTKDPDSKPPAGSNVEYVPTRLTSLKDRMQLPVFDPYEDLGWIVEQPMTVRSIDDVIDPLRDKQRLTLTVELYDETVLLPYPIIGFARWEQSEAYLLIYSQGLRYVPLIDAVRFGRIYLEDDEA